MSIDERIDALVARGLLGEEFASQLKHGNALLPPAIAEQMVENVIGVFGLPFAVAPNFIVNGREHVVPMVVEEPSVVAAVSGAAKLVRDSGGFSATATDPVLIGQVQVVGIDDPDKAVQALFARQSDLLDAANALQPRLVGRGGGAKAAEFFKYRLPDEDWTVVLHLLVDTCDAMGANLVNTMCEGIAPLVEDITGGEVVLRILSNLADKSLVRASVNISLPTLATGGHSAEFVRDSVVLANDFANADPYRAATHNKGIMNGVDAVAIATGNDWRAIEAGAHAFAVKLGAYRSLTSWSVDANGDLVGHLTLPLKPGIVGGSLSANPGARLGLALTGVKSAPELAELMGAVGLAQNLAALRALVSGGIQEGHMRLHARSAALAATDELPALPADEPLDGASIGEASGKVILLGEHAVVYDRHALALPIPAAVRAEVLESDEMSLSMPDQDESTSWSEAAGDPIGPAAIVSLIMREMNIGDRAFRIRVTSRIPVGAGLGASASFAVAIIRAFDALLNRNLSDLEIDDIALQCETLSHGTPSGIDNNLATFGQPVLYSKGSRTRTRPIPLTALPPLIIAASGTRGITHEQVAAVRARYEENTALYTTIFDEIDEMSVAGAAALRDGDYDLLGSLMNVCHGFLNAIQVSTPELERMVSIAREAGATGAKLTGSGGGGSIVALCPGSSEAVSEALADAGYQIVPLAGSTV